MRGYITGFLSNYKKVKILVVTYFTGRESHEQFFNQMTFLNNDQVNLIQFRVYNEFNVHVYVTQQNNEIRATIVESNI